MNTKHNKKDWYLKIEMETRDEVLEFYNMVRSWNHSHSNTFIGLENFIKENYNVVNG